MPVRPKTPEELIRVFADNVQAQDQCINRGKPGNRHANQYIAAARKLLAGGEESIEIFSRLLFHPYAGVRCMAAAFLLKDRTEQAVAVLRPIAAGKGLASLGARMTLERYERGDLEIKDC